MRLWVKSERAGTKQKTKREHEIREQSREGDGRAWHHRISLLFASVGSCGRHPGTRLPWQRGPRGAASSMA